jgi:hypothetical protein
LDSVPVFLYILAVLLAIVLVIAWILLPFAMFGMKPLLRELIAEVQETNRLLAGGAPGARKRDPAFEKLEVARSPTEK